MRSNAALLRRLLDDARAADSVLLPRIEPHPLGFVVGLGGAALGIACARVETLPLRSELGWLALALVALAMLMFQFMLRNGVGWRVDIAARSLCPEGIADARPALLSGDGWALFCVAGSKKRSLAFEFRHADGGKPLRVFQTRGGAGRDEHHLASALADRLAARMQMRRDGLTFQES